MNGSEKTIMHEMFEKMGEVHSDVKNLQNNLQDINDRLSKGDTKFDNIEKQVENNKTMIKVIWGGIAALSLTILGTIFRLGDKIIKLWR